MGLHVVVVGKGEKKGGVGGVRVCITPKKKPKTLHAGIDLVGELGVGESSPVLADLDDIIVNGNLLDVVGALHNVDVETAGDVPCNVYEQKDKS